LYRCLRHVQLHQLQLAQPLFGRLFLFNPQYKQLRVEERYHECHSFRCRFCSSRLAIGWFGQWYDWQWRYWRQRRLRIWILCGCIYRDGSWLWLCDHRPSRRCNYYYCGRWRLGFRFRKRSWHRSRHHNCTFWGHNHYHCRRRWLWTRHWSRYRPGNRTRHRSWNRSRNWARINCLCCLDSRVDHRLQRTNHSFNIWCQHSYQRRICHGKHSDRHYHHGFHLDIHFRAHNCLYRPRCNSIGQWWSTSSYDYSWRR
jgi:hypothetical protein